MARTVLRYPWDRRVRCTSRVRLSCAVLEVESVLTNSTGPTKTNGYYGQTEEQRREVFVDEWMRTGDLGHVDSRGYLFITGRNKVCCAGRSGLED